MTFFFGLLDMVLTSILLYDTIGIVYFDRRGKSCDRRDYTRICFSWILFLAICNFFSCNKNGFFGTLIRLIIFIAKAFVTLPVLGGTMKINKFLFDDGNAQKYYEKIKEIVESKLCSKSHSS